jgi:hypothetical protein
MMLVLLCWKNMKLANPAGVLLFPSLLPRVSQLPTGTRHLSPNYSPKYLRRIHQPTSPIMSPFDSHSPAGRHILCGGPRLLREYNLFMRSCLDMTLQAEAHRVIGTIM